jgi:hypothetical protein
MIGRVAFRILEIQIILAIFVELATGHIHTCNVEK